MCRRVSEAAKTRLGVHITRINLFDAIATGKIIRKHIMKIFWFLKNRIILKTYVFFSLNKQIMFSL